MKHAGWLTLGVLLSPGVAWAAPAPAEELLGRPLALVVALAILSLLPFVFMTLTAFVKISTVLQIVRGAIGAQGVPPGTVITALAAALTVLAMAPVLHRITERAEPLLEGPRAADTSALVKGVVEAVREPLRSFLKANADPRERARFADIARRASPDRAAGPDDFPVLGPAFLTTELREAFALGFALYLPFLVIDLVIANMLVALGLQQLQPSQVSLPFKLLLFVAIDGWGLLAQSLVAGYRPGLTTEAPWPERKRTSCAR
ncbi:MAG: EscR/YscR/HrcR family type III secretion system export apparatus protein [Polyangiaceae bacterium]|jgi:type III secretion protein R|nr:EscR/YscR/HrcR family type III secretion system export apparatus protein [Polyangiaceae bacterium]